MNTEMNQTTKFTPARKPFDWAQLAKRTAVVGGTSRILNPWLYAL